MSAKRKIGLRIYLITIIAVLFGGLFFGWWVWRETYKSIQHGNTNSIALRIAQIPSKIAGLFAEKKNTGRPVQNSSIMFKNKHSQTSNFVTFGNFTDTGYILFSAFDKKIGEADIRLFSLRDKKVIYQWHVNNDLLRKLAPDTVNTILFNKTEFANIHPLLTADTGLLLKAEYAMLYKIDKHSKIQWTLPGNYHHSVEIDADGNYWVSQFIKGDAFDTAVYENYTDNIIAKISPEGKVISSISITKALIDAGYESLLFGVGPYESSPLHINDIQPALQTTPYWQKNDLLVSLHNRSSVILFRPSTNKIIWLKTGPWLNQHDVNFVSNNTISVFGNDVLRSPKHIRSLHGHNELYVYNFETQQTELPYNTLFTREHISTDKSGRGQILENNDVYIEETHYSRVIRANNDGIKWSYQELIDYDWVAKICWSRYYTRLPFNANKK